jgi:phosphoglycerate dehydrogenase-like enzyme
MSDKPTVLLDPYFRKMDEIFSPRELLRLQALAHIIWGKDDPMPSDAFAAALPEAEVLICADWRYGEVLSTAKKLRAVIDVAGAFPIGFDYEYAYAHKIRVLSIAPSFARQVAEMALGMAIASGREIALGDRLFRSGTEKYLHAGNETTFMLYDKGVGFIGFGSIAKALKPLLEPFHVTMVAYDPWLTDGYIRSQGVTPVGIEELLETSNYIFVLAAPSKENKAFLNRDLLRRIQKDAVLLVMSRAHVVDFEALTECVLEGRFRVATDVFPTEPLAANHPIRQAEKVILSAHRAGSVREGLWEIGAMVVDDLEAILRGLPPQRLPVAQPELTSRYAAIVVPKPNE